MSAATPDLSSSPDACQGRTSAASGGRGQAQLRQCPDVAHDVQIAEPRDPGTRPLAGVLPDAPPFRLPRGWDVGLWVAHVGREPQVAAEGAARVAHRLAEEVAGVDDREAPEALLHRDREL